MLLNIFVEMEILFFRIFWWVECSKEQHLFEIEIFCNITNMFIANHFNKSLLNKSQIKKQKILLSPKFWMVVNIWPQGGVPTSKNTVVLLSRVLPTLSDI